MAQNRLDYRDALGLIANAETIVSFRRAIYEILKAIRFGGVYFLAPLWRIGALAGCSGMSVFLRAGSSPIANQGAWMIHCLILR